MSLCRDIAKALGPVPPQQSLVHLRLLATSDLHAHLMPYDYFTDKRDDGVGLVRVAGLVAAARSAAENCILVDNGDTLQGAPLGDLAARELRYGRPSHPMIEAMNALGYDAATLGNHDFDFGLDVLEAALEGAAFPVVLANAQRPGNGAPFRPRHVLLERAVTDVEGQVHSLKIGITGTVPPQVAHWNRQILAGRLDVTDAVEAAANAAVQLRAQGADLVIVLAHSGLGEEPPAPNGDAPPGENVARMIAALPDIDVVVAGHTHEVYPPAGTCAFTPPGGTLVQPGERGSHLGCIDIALVRERALNGARGGWDIRMANAQAFCVRTSETEAQSAGLRHLMRANPPLRKSLTAQHRATRRFTGQRIGETRVPLHTYFSALAPCAATQLISDAQIDAARRAIRGQPELEALPLLSAVAPMRSGGPAGPQTYTDIARGPLLLRHVADLYCYPNNLAILRLTGRDLRTWLERAVSIYRRIDPDDPAPQRLIDHSFAGYNFDRIDGLEYDIDVTVPARTNATGDRINETPGRIRNLRYRDGAPVGDDDPVLVATNTYRAGGGGHFDFGETAQTVVTGTEPVRDLLIGYLRRMTRPVAPEPSPCFRLCRTGRATIVYETGPASVRHAARVGGIGLTPDGLSPEGFRRYRVRL